MKWKNSINRIAADKRNLQKRSLEFKRSLDEVSQLINSITKRKK